MRRLFLFLLLGALLTVSSSSALAKKLSTDEMIELLNIVDDRQRNGGDYKALAFIEQKERGKTDLLYETVIYRRDSDDKLMILFTKPLSKCVF